MIHLTTTFNSAKSVQRLRKKLGLKGTIQQAASFEMVLDIYKVLRGRFPTMGARRMVTVIRQDYSIKVSEYVYDASKKVDLITPGLPVSTGSLSTGS